MASVVSVAKSPRRTVPIHVAEVAKTFGLPTSHPKVLTTSATPIIRVAEAKPLVTKA